MNNVAIVFDKDEPATRQVAAILASYVASLRGKCTVVPIPRGDDISLPPDCNASVIALNQCRLHTGLPLPLRKQKNFMTWIVDSVDWIPPNGFNDLIVGYVEGMKSSAKHTSWSICPVGSPNPADYRKTKPTFDVAITMNGRSETPIKYLESLKEHFTSIGIDFKSMKRLHDAIQGIYETGGKICGYESLWNLIKQDSVLYELAMRLPDRERFGKFLIPAYWGINEHFYRQQAMAWLDELGVNYKVAGLGWERLGDRSVGYISDPNKAIEFLSHGAAGLHLNSMEPPSHRRIFEINMASRPCITRGSGKTIAYGLFNPDQFSLWMLAEVERYLCYVESDYTKPLIENPVAWIEPNRIYFNNKEQLNAVIQDAKASCN